MNTMTSLALATLLATPAAAQAQAKTDKPMQEMTVRIDAIDAAHRLVMVTDDKGNSASIYAGPEVKRFDELKVGDKVTFQYYESVATRIRKPGDAPAAPGSDVPKVTAREGAKPGGTIATQETATVTLKAIDDKVPAVTVLTKDGRTVNFRVEDRKKLAGLKVGDQVDITFTEAVLITVK